MVSPFIKRSNLITILLIKQVTVHYIKGRIKLNYCIIQKMINLMIRRFNQFYSIHRKKSHNAMCTLFLFYFVQIVYLSVSIFIFKILSRNKQMLEILPYMVKHWHMSYHITQIISWRWRNKKSNSYAKKCNLISVISGYSWSYLI